MFVNLGKLLNYIKLRFLSYRQLNYKLLREIDILQSKNLKEVMKLLTFNLRFLVISAIVALSFIVLSTGVLAKQTDNTRPGWGFGDQNHVHTGPPGQSVNPVFEVNQIDNSHNDLSNTAAVNTGGNTVNSPAGGNIVTGAVQVVFSFVSNMGQNIFGS